MIVTLTIPDQMTRDIATQAAFRVETAGVLLAGLARQEGQIRLLAQELHWVPEDQYIVREADRLSIRSGGYTGALARAEEIGAVAIWLHTHPGGWPINSVYDDTVDFELADVFQIRTGQDFFASLVFSPSDAGGFDFSGRTYVDDEIVPISTVWLVGSRFRLISAVDAPPAEQIPPLYDRQVRAFGGGIQGVLRGLKVAVVGAGGTGSAVAEQLARLGVGDLLIVDPDVIEDTNITRVYGSSPSTVGKPKAPSLADHVRTIAPDVAVRSIVGRTTSRGVAAALTDRDVIFGCSDDNAGRLILARLSSYYLVPVIDCGVLLSSEDGELLGIDGRITVMAPGYACLVCRNRIDLARAAAEQLNPEERRQRQDEGYAPELGRVDPAVVTFTTLVAGFAVAELLERLTGYGPEAAPSELILRAHEREISTNSRQPNVGHFCDPATGHLGLGDQEPFLGTAWRTD
ncbi:HesA/MoeB/ThiF family protein [Kribbella sp. NPDC002412]